ncbi:MAG: DUF3019 domain-containing protein [Thiohalomonadales bacterium]
MKITLYPVLISCMALLLFGAIGVNAMAEESSNESAKVSAPTSIVEGAPVLSIDPMRCVLKSGQELCRIQLTLSWQANKAHSVCLTEKGDALILACWEQAVRGAARVLFVGEESVTYVLVNENNTVHSEATLSVGRVSSPKRRSNKRRRRLWSFR